jgi:DNA polymerase
MITLDFETRSAANLLKWGQRRYASDVSTQVLCLAWAYDQEEEVHLWHRGHDWIEKSPTPDELIKRIRGGEQVEAHNAGFEFNIWNLALRREFPEFDVDLEIENMHCSAAKASCLSLPRGLEDAIRAVGLPDHKIADGKRLINKLSKPMRERPPKAITPGATPRDLFKSELYKLYPEPFTTDDAEEIQIAICRTYFPDYYSSEAAATGSIRKFLNEDMVKKGYLAHPEDGQYEWLIKPPTIKLKSKLATYERHVGDDENKIRFNEDEMEHRKNWEYCRQDVRAERGLSNFCPEMSEREREYWLMDFRMNVRGIALDGRAAKEALELARLEAKRLNGELSDVTGGVVQKGSQRATLLKWANGRLQELGEAPLADTKADTLSFKLDGVPTKAGDDAREAAAGPMRAKWDELGEEGAQVERALRICMEVNRSSVAKYRRMTESVCPDGRLHDIMLFNGADRTGRWSGKNVQPHNFVRGYGAGYKSDAPEDEMCDAWNDILTLDREYITMMWGEPMIALAKACRGALIASRNKHLYAADFNAIEARKLAWLSGCATLLNLFNNNGDPYIDMGSAIYGRTITKADKTERQLGKKAILGLGYAMGWEKFQFTVWNDEGIWLEDEFCQKIVRIYRKEKYPEIPALWRSTEKAAIAAVLEGGEHYCGGDEFGNGSVSYFISDDGNFLHCRLPSGRLLAYLYPRVRTRVTYRFAALNERGKPTTVNFPAKKSVPQHRVRWHAEKMAEKQRKRLLPDPPESFLSPHLSFMGRDTYTRQWKRCGTHGGSLVENYDQASSRDLLAEAMYRVDQMDDFDLLLSIHDEVIAEADIGACGVKDFEAIMSVVPDWAPGMPITAEGWIGPRLRK